MVLVRLRCVQDPGVVEQLDVTGPKVHLDVECRVVGDRLEQLHRLELLGSEPRHLMMALASRMYQPM